MLLARQQRGTVRFSALQRAEIAERLVYVFPNLAIAGFSALQRAEIAEMARWRIATISSRRGFQCSSTSRNC